MSTPASWNLDPIPSFRRSVSVTVSSELPGPDAAGAVAVPLAPGTEPPAELGFDRAALAAAGFEAKRGQTLVVPTADGRVLVAVGIGDSDQLDAALVRDLAAEFARAVPHQLRLAIELPSGGTALSPAEFCRGRDRGRAARPVALLRGEEPRGLAARLARARGPRQRRRGRDRGHPTGAAACPRRQHGARPVQLPGCHPHGDADGRDRRGARPGCRSRGAALRQGPAARDGLWRSARSQPRQCRNPPG